MKDYRTLTKHLLVNIVAFLVFANLLWVMTFAYFSEVEHAFWFLSIPFGLLYLIRIKAKNPLVFALLHTVVLLGAVFIIGDPDSWFAVLIFMLVASLYSYYVKAKGERALSRLFGVHMLVLHVILFIFLERLTANAACMQILILLNFIVIAGFIIAYVHIENIDYRLMFLRSLSNYNYNADRVLTFNNKMIAIFAALIMGVGFIGAIFPVGGALVRAFRWVLGPVLRLMQAVHDGFGDEALQGFAPVFTNEDTPLQLSEDGLYVYNEYGLQEFHEYMAVQEVDLTTLFRIESVLIAIFALLLIIFVFYTFFKLFNRKPKSTNAASSSDDTVIALSSNILSDLKAMLPRFKARNRNAIRRAYAKKVNGHIKNGINIQAADTTVIIADKIRLSEDIDELTALYKTVRYGPER